MFLSTTTSSLTNLVLLRFQETDISCNGNFGNGTILGPVIAPTIGGYLGELLNWRWIFYTLVPLGFSSFAVLATVPKRSTSSAMSLDWIGFIALACSVAALQIMFDRGERNSWFESTETIIECGV